MLSDPQVWLSLLTLTVLEVVLSIDNLVVIAVLDRAPVLPPVPDMPLGLSRTCWEHVMRIYEQCDRNVSHTAQRLGMHRRSLQRILGKRAPPLRAPT